MYIENKKIALEYSVKLLGVEIHDQILTTMYQHYAGGIKFSYIFLKNYFTSLTQHELIGFFRVRFLLGLNNYI